MIDCAITAVIPTFNRARLLGRAIESVLNQTAPPSQVIVVDDGSSDNTAQICRTYAGRIEYVFQENAGVSAARNLGIHLARSPWVAFLDSDDHWNGWHLQRMTAAISETAGEAAFYFSDMQLPDAEGGGTLWKSIGFRPGAPHHLVRDASAWALMKRQPTMLQSSVISRQALERIGGFDVRFRLLLEDAHLFCRLGIGGVGCAVTGVGSIQTSDAAPVRLTRATPMGSLKHTAESLMLWTDVLRNEATLPPEFRRLARYNVAGSYWGLARSLMQVGQYAGAAAFFAQAAVCDPSLVLWFLRHRTRRGYEETVRPTLVPMSASQRPFPARTRSERTLPAAAQQPTVVEQLLVVE
ncbi:MAG: glycosyltransferase family A protein [Vicinamibacterales bacterium]